MGSGRARGGEEVRRERGEDRCAGEDDPFPSILINHSQLYVYFQIKMFLLVK